MERTNIKELKTKKTGIKEIVISCPPRNESVAMPLTGLVQHENIQFLNICVVYDTKSTKTFFFLFFIYRYS